jgi:PAS domain S-box-containing protein
MAGLNVSAEEFLGAVLETTAQPIWVVDAGGVIRFANPAAIDALGYDGAQELLGRHSHATIHYKRPDGSPFPAADCPLLLPRTTGETVSQDLDWFVRRDGSLFPVSYVSVPLEFEEGRGAVVAFSDIGDRLRGERVLREHDALLEQEKATLRRVASLVAGGAASPAVFAAIAREVAQVLRMALVVIWRYAPGQPASVVAAWGDRPHPFATGGAWPVEPQTAAAMGPQVGRPVRVEDFGAIEGALPAAIAGTGIRAGAGAAIVVDGRFWGIMGVGAADGEPLPDGVEERLAELTDLLATAISNSEARQQLAASRARVVAAADEERRRVVRDLHDGAQQRLVHTVVTLKLAVQALEKGAEGAGELVRDALRHAQRATDELRELAHGILPTVLSRGGLPAAVGELASRMSVPVAVDVAVDRLSAAIEATAYFTVAEALTNVAKHARAERASVAARVEGDTLLLAVRDNGIGGADLGGHGLLGLADRIAAVGGELTVQSPLDGGTLVTAKLPLARNA